MTSTAEKIWDDVAAGNIEALWSDLRGASVADFTFEKQGGESYKLPALLLSAYKGQKDILTVLIQAGVDVNLRDSKYKETALHWACGRGHTDIAVVLLEANADVNLQTKLGMTPLMHASYSGHIAEVKLLLKANADPNVQDKNGMTALMYASQHGHVAIVQTLLKESAKPNLTDKKGVTALMWAARGGHTVIVVTLLEGGADRNLRDKDNKSAAEWAKNEKTRMLINTYTHKAQARPLPPLPSTPSVSRRPPSSSNVSAASPATTTAAPSPAPGSSPAPGASPALANATAAGSEAEYPHKACMADCDTMLLQVSLAPERRDAVLKKNELLERLNAALESGEDFDRLGELGQQLDALELESSQIKLSEEDFVTLADRHAALVQKVDVKCKQYKANKQAPLLIELGTKLAALKALDMSVCPRGTKVRITQAPSSHDADKLQRLLRERDTLVQQMSGAMGRRDLVKRKTTVEQRLAAVEADDDPDYALMGRLMLEQQILEQESAQLPLSEEDYLALGDRHAALVRDLTTMCRELALAKQYTTLRDVSAQLAALKTMDLSALTTSSDNEQPHSFGTPVEGPPDTTDSMMPMPPARETSPASVATHSAMEGSPPLTPRAPGEPPAAGITEDPRPEPGQPSAAVSALQQASSPATPSTAKSFESSPVSSTTNNSMSSPNLQGKRRNHRRKNGRQ